MHLPGGRERNPVACTVEELRPERFLKVLDARARRGKRHVDTLGAAGQAVFLGNANKKPEVREIKMGEHPIPSLPVPARLSPALHI